MHARSTAAIALAVMCTAALGEARAQRLEPQTSIDFIALSGGARCTDRLVFEHALSGAPICGDLTTSRPTTVDKLFLNEHEREAKQQEAKQREAEVAREREVERGVERHEGGGGGVTEGRTETAKVVTEGKTEKPKEERPRHEGEVDVTEPVTATPEPATLALVASGMAGLAAYRKRRAKRSE